MFMKIKFHYPEILKLSKNIDKIPIPKFQNYKQMFRMENFLEGSIIITNIFLRFLKKNLSI